jgi:hypothetical protein
MPVKPHDRDKGVDGRRLGCGRLNQNVGGVALVRLAA